MTMKGACFCRAIRFTVLANPTKIYQCHCSECRKTTGSSANAGFIIDAAQLEWNQGKENISTYQSRSGYTVNFCPTCGSPVPNPTTLKNKMWVPAGLLEEGEDQLVVKHHLYVGSKASWDNILDDAQQHHTLPDDITLIL